jgi:hypothetical protein
VLIDMPADYGSLLTTLPIYRSTCVFAYRTDCGIKINACASPLDIAEDLIAKGANLNAITSRGVSPGYCTRE